MSDSRRSRNGQPAPWYSSGLRFECRPDCGACCVNHGESNCVFVDDEDSERLAHHLELSREEFRQRYTRAEGDDRVLVDEGDGCVFLVGRRCTVYDGRPKQCRTFPFWPENLRSRRSWNQLGGFCPGIDEGDLHSPEQIRVRLAEHEDD